MRLIALTSLSPDNLDLHPVKENTSTILTDLGRAVLGFTEPDQELPKRRMFTRAEHKEEI